MAMRFSDALLEQVRAMLLTTALESLGYHVAVDRDFTPAKDVRSQRWIIAGANGSASELVVTGVKWFDTRGDCGGCGAVDLVMHLEQLSFVAAVKCLAGALRP